MAWVSIVMWMSTSAVNTSACGGATTRLLGGGELRGRRGGGAARGRQDDQLLWGSASRQLCSRKSESRSLSVQKDC